MQCVGIWSAGKITALYRRLMEKKLAVSCIDLVNDAVNDLIEIVRQDKSVNILSMTIDAVSGISINENARMDELCVDTLMKLVKDDERLIILAACNSLKRVGTKREVDRLLNYADETEDEEVKKALTETALMCKERTPRF